MSEIAMTIVYFLLVVSLHACNGFYRCNKQQSAWNEWVVIPLTLERLRNKANE